MFEDLDKLDNGECTEMYNLPGECFPRVSNPERNSHDNLELLESELARSGSLRSEAHTLRMVVSPSQMLS